MPAASFRLVVAATVFATLFARSASATSPPLAQLGLRDALLAKPEVIAALPPEAHQQLAQRFEESRRHPGSLQELLVATELTPVEVIRTVDLGRLARGRDALIAGQVRITPLGIEVPFFTDSPADAAADVAAALPPLEGIPAAATAEAEASALRGIAGSVLQALLQQSQATRLVRVVSWPVAAVAIQDAVYVNAAWLIAMGPPSASSATAPAGAAGAPVESGCGGAVGTSSQGGLSSSGAPAYVSDPETAAAAQTTRIAAPPSPRSDAPLRSGDDAQRQTATANYLWAGGGGGSGHTSAAQSHTADGLPISSLTYALDSAATSSTDCCRYTSNNGCDTQAPCQSSSSSCNSGSGSGCNSGSGSGCNSGSSGCNSGSSGCNSGSCNSGSCNSGSGCGSGSGSGCSGGSCGKCSLTPMRPRGEIPDAATLAFLLAPLGFLIMQERRWRR